MHSAAIRQTVLSPYEPLLRTYQTMLSNSLMLTITHYRKLNHYQPWLILLHQSQPLLTI